MKRCKKCGGEIIDRLPRARYCSIECQERRRSPNYVKPTRRPKPTRRAVFPAWRHIW